MTNQEINLTYNAFRGVHSFQGDINVLTGMTHYFLMDASYDNFKHRIATRKLKHKEKQMVSKMARAYDSFFTRFLAPFSLDQRIFLGDKSDALREHIANDVERARLAMMDCCDDCDLDTQTEIADIWLCNRFASEAQGFYQRVWKKDGFMLRGMLFTKPDSDKDIDAILKYTLQLTEALYGDGEDVTPKHYEKFQACVEALTRKICVWLNEDYKNQIGDERRDAAGPALA